ncbi:hypothetical protein AQZ52_14675 [Novosphingobium fuchskuhlense]|uniref:Proteophosphoglycan n=1 Tax=Novosphingobium fuchskuhlense TaxID=1117702 RepID=A0A117USN0_9SPHN|nr:DUF1285 domain-containing protein [Novosphingobium fuchskuhlense]KUR70109.1 hypothetical protein AQZ52_14675 [Novosphingobium fuchskuhlense]
MPYEPPAELAALTLAELAEAVAARRLPAVDTWSPARTGTSHMRIAADGTWFHEGGRITRPAMVRAFSSLLTRDAAGQHWLVTPAEKLAIEVEDAAFIATDLEVRADSAGSPVIALRLNTDDVVLAGPDHPLIARGTAEVPAFYLAVRHGTEARLNRSTYGQLIDHALAVSPPDALAVESLGASFPLLPA